MSPSFSSVDSSAGLDAAAVIPAAAPPGSTDQPTSSAAPPTNLLERVLGFVSALPVALIVIITFIDVFARYLFSSPLRGGIEIIEQAMALTIFTALPLVTRQRQHISVGLFDEMVKGKARRFKVATCDAVSCVALALLTWRLWLQAIEDLEGRNATLVLGLPHAPLVFSMTLLAAVATALMLVMTWNSVRTKGEIA
jgi:TRAP-type C4-dicarboxylate transport system permease small subunit